MSVTAPPRPPQPDDPVDREELEALVKALIEEARQRARRRRRIYTAVAAGVALVAVAVATAVERATHSQTASPALAAPSAAAHPKVALPQELSIDANGSVVLLRRDGRRLPFLTGIHAPRGKRQNHLYGGREWSPDGSKLLVQRWGYGLRALEVTDETGKVV